MFRTLVYIVICLFLFTHADIYICPKLTKIWGPGLSPDKIVMPARYFFIHAVDVNNTMLTKSAGEVFTVTAKGDDLKRQGRQPWVQVLDRGDGSYVVRYKLFSTLHNFEINILHKGEHVHNSPYKVEGPVYADSCKCPVSSLDKWLEDFECPKSYDQISKDLKLFAKVRFSKLHETAIQRFNQPGSMSVCNYVIKDNEVYRKCYGQHVGFKMFVDAILLSLTRKAVLPPLEFLVNLGDWPLSSPVARPAVPLFSWCASDDTIDIHLPTYDITESTLQCMGRVMLDMLSVQGNANLPWEEREPRAFWRGRDSRRERLKLVELSRQHPELLNASLTNFFFFKNEEAEYGPKVEHVSFFEFFRYRYQVCVDGTVAAYRLPYLLAGGSLVFKQESRYHEHFYHKLIPYEHYVPVKADLSDLLNRIRWALENDAEAERIAKNGRKFAQENLLPKDIFCYHGRLLQEWSRRLIDPVEVRQGMEHVPQDSAESGKCDCQRVNETPDESLQKDEL